MTSAPPASTRGVVPRALALLRSLAAGKEVPQSVSNLARATGIPQQTAHRILCDLADGGLVLHDSATRKWSLGPMALTLGTAAQRHVSWIQTACSVLEEITAKTDETTILTLREGAYASHANIVESPQRLRLTEHVGMRRPLTVGASRRAILAFTSVSERDAILGVLAADGVSVDAGRVARQCAEISERGYAVSGSEVSDHTVGIAVPIFRNDEPVASLLAAGPEYRMTDDVIESTAKVLMDRTNWLHRIWADPANQ